MKNFDKVTRKCDKNQARGLAARPGRDRRSFELSEDKISQPLQTGFAGGPRGASRPCGRGAAGALRRNVALVCEAGPDSCLAQPLQAEKALSGAALALSLGSLSALGEGEEVLGTDLHQSEPLRHEADAGELRGRSRVLGPAGPAGPRSALEPASAAVSLALLCLVSWRAWSPRVWTTSPRLGEGKRGAAHGAAERCGHEQICDREFSVFSLWKGSSFRGMEIWWRTSRGTSERCSPHSILSGSRASCRRRTSGRTPPAGPRRALASEAREILAPLLFDELSMPEKRQSSRGSSTATATATAATSCEANPGGGRDRTEVRRAWGGAWGGFGSFCRGLSAEIEELGGEGDEDAGPGAERPSAGAERRERCPGRVPCALLCCDPRAAGLRPTGGDLGHLGESLPVMQWLTAYS